MGKLHVWIQAFRLRTLPLAFSCILMGAFLAASKGAFDVAIFTLCLLTTLFLQILSNLANDYGDASSGVDGTDRRGPLRTVQAGLITRQTMKRALVVFSLLALASGVILLRVSFGNQWPEALVFLVVGFGAIAAAIKYTVGKNPYGYAGWGDFFVLLFFGVVGVMGSYYLFVREVHWDILLPSVSCGLFAVAVLNVNNIRDIESDRKSGKYSIPVRIGREKAVIYHWIILLVGLLSAVLYVVGHIQSSYSWLFLLVVPLLVVNAWAVRVKQTSAELDPFLKQMALTTLLFVVLFGIGQL